MQYKKVIFVDIDETVARVTNRGYYDWHLVSQDKPILPIIDLVRRYRKDHKIVFITGRSEVCRKDTERWLRQHEVPFDALFMKEQGETRDSAIFKEYTAKQFIMSQPIGLEVSVAIDDRPKIIKMWKSYGIQTIQV